MKIPNIKNLEKRIIFITLAGLILYIFLAVFADAEKLFSISATFNWWLIFPILGLASLNYLIRFLRWQYYLRVLKLKIDIKLSSSVFFSGLLMSITPGKFGELLKSYLLKKTDNIPVSISAPIVLVERLTDLVAVLILASLGIFSFNYGEKIFWLVLAVILLLIVLISYRPLAFWVIRHCQNLPRFKNLGERLKQAYLSAYKLCVLPRLLVGSLLGVLAWFCECLAFYLLLFALGVEISLPQATFIYAFATLAGAISFLPGGLGVTEASLAGLLILFVKLGRAKASFAVILIRLSTLWFAVLVGVITILLNRKRLKL